MNPKARENEIILQWVEDELLIYDLTGNRAVSLNKTAATVWSLCDGILDLEEIADKASIQLAGDVPSELVGLAISQLSAEGLLEAPDNLPAPDRKSRREIIKRLGYVSIVALPIVASIAVPSAANAQSCLDFNVSCNIDSECCPTGVNNMGITVPLCCKTYSQGINVVMTCRAVGFTNMGMGATCTP